MDAGEKTTGEDRTVGDLTRTQLQHFTDADSRCRALQLPEGIMLRYTLSRSLYFYLWTSVENGKIMTRVFSSDSPYERQKAAIGEVGTSMFEMEADHHHLQKLERLLRSWVDFVADDSLNEKDFAYFPMT